jgi:hypothetical protein
MPMVMVDIAPPEPPSELARALLDACSTAVRVGSCSRFDRDLTTGGIPPGTAAATVRWETADGRHVQIEVGIRGEDQPAPRSRSLEFAATDPLVERWRSVGLTIATLAGEISRESGAEPLEEAPVPRRPKPRKGPDTGDRRPEPPSAREPPRREMTRETLWTTVAAIAGPGLEDGAWRAGAWADIGWRPTRLPLFARLNLAFAARPADSRGVSVQWETVTLGAGGVAGEGRFTLQPRVSASFDSVRAGVTDPATGQKDSGSTAALGVHAGADAVLRFVDYAGAVASLDVWHVSGPANILLQDHRVGISAANGWVIGLGFRFFLQ